MLAHIRNGAIIMRFNNPGKITLEDGRRVHSPQEGFVDGNDKVVPVEVETTDTSTGPNKVTQSTTTVEANRVLDATTIRDMTAQEIDAAVLTKTNDAEAKVFTEDMKFAAVMMTLRDSLKAVRDGQLDGLTDAQITTQLKTRFRANYEALQ